MNKSLRKLAVGLAACGLLTTFQASAASLEFVSSSPITGATTTRAGYPSPQGNLASYTNAQNLAAGGAVQVSGTIAGLPGIHNAAYLTDGYYGNGSSWIDTAVNPWLVIDLGSIRAFDTLSFGRDRLGNYTDRSPGQFSLWVSNDNASFSKIFDSSTYGFAGILSSAQTVQANFDLVSAKYVKVQLTNFGAAIDEVEIRRTSASVPEPATALLFGTAVAALLGARRRKGR